MAITNTRLTSTDPITVFTASGQQAITVMYICNSQATGNVNVSVHCVDSGDSSGSSEDNIIYSNLVVQPNDTYVLDTEKLILDNNDFIDVEASVANAVTITVSSISV